MELISVIIPTHNRWPMLGEAVESVCRQGYKEYELIIVDDGSDDVTAARLKDYGARISVLRQPRKGVASARNLGVCHARGEYLCFLDSDDLWLPRKLEAQMAFMKAGPGVRICQTEEIWIRNGVRVNPKVKHRKPSGDIFRPSLELCLVSPSSVMMTRELFEEVGGFDESLPVCEDYDLWLRVAARDTPVPLLAEALTIKRGGHGDQLSRSTWGLDRFRVQALEKLLPRLRGEKREWVLEVLRRKIGILAHGARKRGKHCEAGHYEAILARPGREVDDDGWGNRNVR